MCDVPSIAVFIVNLLNAFLVWRPDFFPKPSVTILVAPIFTGYYYYYYYYYHHHHHHHYLLYAGYLYLYS